MFRNQTVTCIAFRTIKLLLCAGAEFGPNSIDTFHGLLLEIVLTANEQEIMTILEAKKAI